MSMKSRDGTSNHPASASFAEFWEAVVQSEAPAGIEATWFPRSESLQVWGTKCFDHDLKLLPRASDAAALEIRLVRESDDDVYRAKLEIRTSLALFARTSTGSGVKQLWSTIGSAQRELAKRWGLPFHEAKSLKPHVLTHKPRRLIRAYGKHSVFDSQRMASRLLRAYWLLAWVWRAALRDPGGATISRVRSLAEDTIATENRELRYLFAGHPPNRNAADQRPALTDELLKRIGRALGCRPLPGGLYGPPRHPIVVESTPPPGIVRLVTEDLSAQLRLSVEAGRKVLRQSLTGELNGFVFLCTEAEAAAMRAVHKKSQRKRARRPGKLRRRIRSQLSKRRLPRR
jgi:hypothetical protein